MKSGVILIAVVLGFLSFLPMVAVAQPKNHDPMSLTVSGPFARAASQSAQSTTVYMTIANNGNSADKLIGAASAAAERVELHKIMNDHGLRRMHEVEEIPLPAHTTVPLKMGASHLMLIGLKQSLIAGTTVPVELHFASSGKVMLSVPVVQFKAKRKGVAN